MKKILLFAVVAILGTSCATIGATATVTSKVDTGKTFAVVDAKFSERILPIIPLIDAGMYNNGVNEVLEDLIAAEKEAAAELTQGLIDGFAAKSGSEVKLIENVMIAAEEFGEPSLTWAKNLAAENEVDYIIVPMARVNTTGVSGFGFTGYSHLKVTVDIIGADGTLYADGFIFTETTSHAGNDVAIYKVITKRYAPYLGELIDLLLADAE
jgi:hypothetical protein